MPTGYIIYAHWVAIASSLFLCPLGNMSEKDQHLFKDRYMLRLPEGMRARIKAAAEAEGRSMNAEIVRVLEEHFPAPKLPSIGWKTYYLISNMGPEERDLFVEEMQGYWQELGDPKEAEMLVNEIRANRVRLENLEKRLGRHLTESEIRDFVDKELGHKQVY